MAKSYRRRRYYRRRGKHWSTRLTNFSGSQSAAVNANYVIYQNLCQNPAQDNDTISQLYTVKNVDCTIELQSNSSNIENFQVYIMYVPQGYIPTGVPSAYETLPYDHPEWIMAYRYYGSPNVEYVNAGSGSNLNTPGFPPLRLKSRLARKLDTGDRVIALIIGTNASTVSQTLDYNGLVKYNTKAN